MGRQTFDNIQLPLYSLTNSNITPPLSLFLHRVAVSKLLALSVVCIETSPLRSAERGFSIVLGVVGGCGCLEDYFIRRASWSCLVFNPLYIKSSWIRFAFESWRRFLFGLEISLTNRRTLPHFKAKLPCSPPHYLFSHSVALISFPPQKPDIRLIVCPPSHNKDIIFQLF